MEVVKTSIPDLLVLEPSVFCDERGCFLELWNQQTFAKLGLTHDFVQDNQSCSARGVLRGLHFQHPDFQGKLVHVAAGRAWDVAVDLRLEAATFGNWEAVELSAENQRQFWIPPGFAHGFLALEENTIMLYKCTALYNPANEYTLSWDDPELAIEWPTEGLELRLSAKDRQGMRLSDCRALT